MLFQIPFRNIPHGRRAVTEAKYAWLGADPEALCQSKADHMDQDPIIGFVHRKDGERYAQRSTESD